MGLMKGERRLNGTLPLFWEGPNLLGLSGRLASNTEFFHPRF